MNEARDNAGVIAPPPLLALATIILGLLLDWLLPSYVLTLLLPFVWRILVGIILMGAGSAMIVRANLDFRSVGTNPEPWKPSTALVTGGIFGWLRNPMYVGATAVLIGLAVLLASDWMLVMTIIFVLVLHFGVVRREERYLEARFGTSYEQYRNKVPRYGWPG